MASYFIYKDNAPTGPHSDEEVTEMLAKGVITGETLVVIEGGTDWQPASELFPQSPSPAAPPPPSPPPVPQPRPANPYSAPAAPLEELPETGGRLDFPMIIEGKIVPGTEGLTAGQVVELCRRGGRFVIWQYAISIVVLSFRRNSGIRFLRPGKDGAGQCLLYSAIAGAVGWWGIPWGIFWTLQSIFRNMGGGQDVTEPVLKLLVPPREADSIVRSRPARSKFRVALAAMAVLAIPFLLIALLASMAPSRERSRRTYPPSGSRTTPRPAH